MTQDREDALGIDKGTDSTYAETSPTVPQVHTLRPPSTGTVKPCIRIPQPRTLEAGAADQYEYPELTEPTIYPNWNLAYCVP